jgi:hypothetical protein
VQQSIVGSIVRASFGISHNDYFQRLHSVDVLKAPHSTSNLAVQQGIRRRLKSRDFGTRIDVAEDRPHMRIHLPKEAARR